MKPPLVPLTTMVLPSVLLLSLALVITAEAPREAEGPRSVVLVVAPLAVAQQRLLGAAMPVSRRLATCSRHVYPWWQLDPAANGCECASALDHSLRHLARWAREARGMPTAVITALHPFDSEAEPIVLTMSLPETKKVEVQRRSNALLDDTAFLGAIFGGRKLLGKLEHEPIRDNVSDSLESEDIGIPEEQKMMFPFATGEEGTTVTEGSIPPHETDTSDSSNSSKSTIGASGMQEEYDMNKSSEEILVTETKERAHKVEKLSISPDISTEKINAEQKDRIQCKGHLHGKGNPECSQKHNHSSCHGEARGGAIDLPGVHIALGEVHRMMMNKWLRELGLVAEAGAKAEAKAKAEAETGPRAAEARAPSALLRAVHRALHRLEEVARARRTLFIVRSVAPLSGDALSALLEGVGLPLTGDGAVAPVPASGPEASAEPRLVAVLDGCPTLHDDALDVFMHGPGSSSLQHATSLEELVRGLQAIIHAPQAPEPRAEGVEELAAVEAPRQRKGLRHVRMHVAPVRAVHATLTQRGAKQEDSLHQASETRRAKRHPLPSREGQFEKRQHAQNFFRDLLRKIRQAREVPAASASHHSTAPALPSTDFENVEVLEGERTNTKESMTMATKNKTEDTSDMPKENQTNGAITSEKKNQEETLTSKKEEEENIVLFQIEQNEEGSTMAKLKEHDEKSGKEFVDQNFINVSASSTTNFEMSTTTTTTKYIEDTENEREDDVIPVALKNISGMKTASEVATPNTTGSTDDPDSFLELQRMQKKLDAERTSPDLMASVARPLRVHAMTPAITPLLPLLLLLLAR